MLSKENNELLTRIGPGTPMGTALRQYWVPALRAAKLVSDGAPVRVRLFGENFVAFRATNGQIGFLDEACPHRGVSLALARNEDCALRCIFHGWKIDVSGQVVEIPAEPADSNLASKIQVSHYPVREAGGMVWVWLGQGDTPTPFPDLEFTHLPDSQVEPRGALLHCNWLQAVEGLLDSSHVSLLHQSWLRYNGATGKDIQRLRADTAPRYEVEQTSYGLRATAIRSQPDGNNYARVTEYVLPYYGLIPQIFGTMRFIVCPIPIDDAHTMTWYFVYDTAQEVDRNAFFGSLVGPNPDNIYEPRFEPEESWGQDRAAMAQGHFTGLKNLLFEDFVTQESMGVIADRSNEHLGVSDTVVIKLRRLLQDVLQDSQAGKLSRGLEDGIDFRHLRASEIIIKPGEDWREVHEALLLTR